MNVQKIRCLKDEKLNRGSRNIFFLAAPKTHGVKWQKRNDRLEIGITSFKQSLGFKGWVGT
jgi:hypothetical protein